MKLGKRLRSSSPIPLTTESCGGVATCDGDTVTGTEAAVPAEPTGLNLTTRPQPCSTSLNLCHRSPSPTTTPRPSALTAVGAAAASARQNSLFSNSSAALAPAGAAAQSPATSPGTSGFRAVLQLPHARSQSAALLSGPARAAVTAIARAQATGDWAPLAETRTRVQAHARARAQAFIREHRLEQKRVRLADQPGAPGPAATRGATAAASCGKMTSERMRVEGQLEDESIALGGRAAEAEGLAAGLPPASGAAGGGRGAGRRGMPAGGASSVAQAGAAAAGAAAEAARVARCAAAAADAAAAQATATVSGILASLGPRRHDSPGYSAAAPGQAGQAAVLEHEAAAGALPGPSDGGVAATADAPGVDSETEAKRSAIAAGKRHRGASCGGRGGERRGRGAATGAGAGLGDGGPEGGAGEQAAEAAQARLRSVMDRSPLPGRPTHFLALQLAHAPRVRDAIERVQCGLTAHHPSLADFLEPPVKAHLTLLVMPLHLGHLPHLPPPPHLPPVATVRPGSPAALELATSADPPERLVPEAEPVASERAEPPQQPWAPLRAAVQHGLRLGIAAGPAAAALPWRLVACLQRMLELPAVLGAAGADRPLRLGLRGLGAFGGRVLFLEVADDGPGGAEPTVPQPSAEEAAATPAVGPARGFVGLPVAGGTGGGAGCIDVGGGCATAAIGLSDGAAGADDGSRVDRPVGQRAALVALQAAVAAHFADFKLKEEDRPFSPHVTIAKTKYMPPGARTRASTAHGNADAGKDGAGSAGGVPHGGNGAGATRPSDNATAEEEGPQRGLAAAQQGQEAAAADPASAAAAVDAPAGCCEGTIAVTDDFGNTIIELPRGAPAAPTAQTQTRCPGREQRAQRDLDKPLSKIPAEAYAAFMDIDAGSVLVDRVQLCAMAGRPHGGYYRVLAEVMLAGGGDGPGGGGSGGGGDSGSQEGGGGGSGSGGDGGSQQEGERGGAGLLLLAAEALRPHPALPPAVRLSEQALALLHAAAQQAEEEERQAGDGEGGAGGGSSGKRGAERKRVGCALM